MMISGYLRLIGLIVRLLNLLMDLVGMVRLRGIVLVMRSLIYRLVGLVLICEVGLFSGLHGRLFA